MIYQTRGSVSFDFQTPRSGLKKRGSSEVFWKLDETLFRVCDRASQTV